MFQTGGRGGALKRHNAVRGSLYNRSIEETINTNAATQQAGGGDHSPMAYNDNTATPTVNTAMVKRRGMSSKKISKPTSRFQTYFVIKLLDPQVNFLDVKTHSSLIIVASISSMDGKRQTTATVPPAPSDGLLSSKLHSPPGKGISLQLNLTLVCFVCRGVCGHSNSSRQ